MNPHPQRFDWWTHKFAAIVRLTIVLCIIASSQFALAESTGTYRIDTSVPWSQVVEVQQGDRISITASGQFTARCEDQFGQGDSLEVGPEGTFLISEALADQKYPLAAGNHGPAPAFALVGYIDDGRGRIQGPFFVGAKSNHVAKQNGVLCLGINDFQPTKNTGQLSVQVSLNGTPDPLRLEHRVRPNADDGHPVDGCRVVVFYVDGLRPDVVQEMAAMGHVPNIRKLFLDNGTWLANTFTAFPSDTITSNGTMWTGCFSDRHGLKAQVRFSRATLQSASYLETLGPSRSSRLISPQGVDRFAADGERTVRSWIQGDQDAKKWYQRHVTDTPAIYEHLRRNGQDWSTGLLPLMTNVPPLLWTRSISQELPWLAAHNAWQYVDDANANYAIRHLFHEDQPVTILWFPETDSVSHKQCRGQFGSTRRTIVKADALVGRVVEHLRQSGRFESTYFMLVSDHGHHGGRVQHIRHFDLANELFFRAREVKRDGTWVGGGLGMSVRMHRFWNRHPDHHQREFTFIDGDSDGAARIFLPRKHFTSRNWSGPNSPGDLLEYRIHPDSQPFNLLSTLADARAAGGERAIDLVLMRLNKNSILVTTAERGSAVIDRRVGQSGRWVYRYRPLQRVWSDGKGGVFYRVNTAAKVDPIGLTKFLDPRHFENYFSERAWLEATAFTAYPDAVVSLTRHMLWQEDLEPRRKEYAPDLVVTARPGWYFGTKETPGTTHGYPLADAMRASWFVSGPNIRRGARIDAPARLADLTPTILDIVGVRDNGPWFDGFSQRQIFQSPNAAEALAARNELKRHAARTAHLFLQRKGNTIRLTSLAPKALLVDTVAQDIHWSDVDLQGWKPLQYRPDSESKRKPFTINRPTQMIDLNNTFYNAAAVADVSVFRVFDDVLFPLAKSRPTDSRVRRLDQRLRNSKKEWVANGARALNVSEVAVSDYTISSLGNLQRADGIVNWIQERGTKLNKKINNQNESRANQVVNNVLDDTQEGFWELYRFGQRVTIKALDETLLNGIENMADRAINSVNQEPSEIVVE